MPDIITDNATVPSINSPLIDRYRNITPVWYPFFQKLMQFIQGIASGTLIVDGWIQARMISAGLIEGDMIAANTITADNIATGAITADEIAAGSITADRLDVDNVDVLNGTFGTLKTNTTSTRVEITDASNALVCYVGGVAIASIGAEVISTGAFINCTSSSALWYPATFYNTSATGGALVCQTVGGYTIQSDQTTSSAGNHYAGVFRNSTGGHAALGASSGNGSYAGLAVAGTWFPFTGSHPGLLLKGESPDVGDIMVEGAVVAKSIDDVICYVSRSTAPNQPGIGAYTHRYPLHGDTLMPALGLRGRGTGSVLSDAAWDALKAGYDYCAINAVGEGAINVCGEGGDIAAGDLIVTSSMPGKGMRQSDNIVRSHSVAKAREAYSFASPTDTAQIACFYIAG